MEERNEQPNEQTNPTDAPDFDEVRNTASDMMRQAMPDIQGQIQRGLTQGTRNWATRNVINLLPLSSRHKRDIANRIARGEPLGLNMFLPRITMGRIIGWVISGVVLIVILIMVARGGG